MTHLVEPGRLRASLVTSTAPPAGDVPAGRGTRRWVEVEHHRTTSSTNARALELARPGLVVVADHQSAGRGRLARSWESAPGASLLLTATVPLSARDAGWLPLLAGLAVRRALADVGGPATVLKWPNDVLVPSDDERKLCGVLCEVGAGDHGPVVAVGLGVNVTQRRDELPVTTATSLAVALGADAADAVDLTDLAVAVLRRLGATYDALSAGGAAGDGERHAYREACATVGRPVRLTRVTAPDVVGRAVEVDDEGRLVIVADGERSAWAAGDVVHVRPPA